MRTSVEATRELDAPADLVARRYEPDELRDLIQRTLDDAKAEDIVTIDLKGKSSIGDYMIIASGLSNRHVGAVTERVVQALKENKQAPARVEGMPECNWVVVDAGSVIVHVFQPEAREFYKLEKMWSSDRPADPSLVASSLPDSRSGNVN